jgi:hypothetical protein
MIKNHKGKITMNDNTNNNSQSLSEVSNTAKGTKEQGALKEIHREYNKLNGYEAMLHIINRFRFVLYPFIFLSIMGSSYSFYNDFIKSFPMNAEWLNLAFAIFLSVMLEIVRDGSLIALFVKKMNIASRLLVVAIFLSVTTYMYSSHLQAIKVIEEMAVKYTLNHQTTSSVSKSNPEIAMTADNLAEAKKDLKDTKAEYKKQLDISANAKYAINKINAQKQLPILRADEKEYQAKVTEYQTKLLALQHKNIDDVTDSQKIISRILLSTLILIESLAMLGAVIKFIHSDNAKAEIAKHSEIVEEYVEISEQMKSDNEELTKNLSNNVKAQSETNQTIMKVLSDDMRETSKLNLGFIESIAENKREMMQQMNEVLKFVAQQPLYQQSVAQTQQQPIAQQPTAQLNNGQAPQQQQPQQPREPQMGFRLPPQPQQPQRQTVDELIDRLGLKKVFTGANNNGAIYAYLYKGYLIQNNREAIITQPKKGYIQTDSKYYGGMPFIETSAYNNDHTPLYTGEQTALENLIKIVDGFGLKQQKGLISHGAEAIKSRDGDDMYLYKGYVSFPPFDHIIKLKSLDQIQNGVLVDETGEIDTPDYIMSIDEFKNYVDQREPQKSNNTVTKIINTVTGKNKKTKEEMIIALYKDGAVQEGGKLAPKSAVVNTKKRQQNQMLTDFYKELESLNVVENRGLGRNGGYYAVADFQTALNKISEVK